MWWKREFWVSWKKCNPRRKPTPFSFSSHAIHTCFNQLFFNLVYGVLQLLTNSYGHFCFAELERKLKGNVDCINNTFTSFHIYRVSQKFVSPISCPKTIDENLIFHEISRRCLLLYRVHVIRHSKFSERYYIKPYEGTILTTGKVAASNIFSYFVTFGYTGERLISGLRRDKDCCCSRWLTFRQPLR